jgi:hypothetical protein
MPCGLPAKRAFRLNPASFVSKGRLDTGEQEADLLTLDPCGAPASAQAKYPPALRELPASLTGPVGNWSRGWSLC